VPALVSAAAGIAERYPSALHGLVLPDAEDDRDLAARLLAWRAEIPQWRARSDPLGAVLRARCWQNMASEIV
jgi:hypothetical protein